MSKNSQGWRFRSAGLFFTLGGFALRVYRLGAESLWYDETVSAHLAAQGIPDLLAHTAGDIHPPGYYLLLHLWTRLAGDSEFALTFFSLFFGVLLIPLTYALARRLLGQRVGLWSALLVAVSPYNLWYSQEARMYTLGAVLGLLALWCALDITDPRTVKATKRWYLAGYVLAAAVGLYVLYYFGFLLVALNLSFFTYLLLKGHLAQLRNWLLAQAGVVLLYLPWLPIAWRQATQPPVPPWRGLIPPQAVALEAWTALSLGQSIQPGQVWPILIVTGILFLLGLQYQTSNAKHLHWAQAQASQRSKLRPQPSSPVSRFPAPNPQLLLLTYTFAPLLLIYLASLVVPLYHVRYLFTYAPPFYILLGSGLAWLGGRSRPLGLLAALALLAGSAFSVREQHANPRYAADDIRAAVTFIAQRWRPGDAILINAGYTYTGFLYYYDGPLAGRVRLTDFHPLPDPASAVSQYPLLLSTGTIGGEPSLGWGDPASDFYATTQAETAAALGRVEDAFYRIWMLRLYDTVTDPDGFIRAWLASNTQPFEDQAFTGQSFMRVQGFVTRNQPPPPPATPINLEGGMTLLGWEADSTAPAGEALDVVFWWQADLPATAYAVSLKLWGKEEDGGTGSSLAAQEDEWPLGSLFLTPDWPPGYPIRHPMRLWLPRGLPPGDYWLTVEMYDPSNVQPLPRLDGQGHTISVGAVSVTPAQ